MLQNAARGLRRVRPQVHGPLRALPGLVAFLVAGALLTPAPGAQLTTEPVASGFSEPLFVTSPPADADRLFVVEHRGKIKIVENGSVLATPFLDLSAIVSQDINGGGLLCLEFHPDYATNGWFYVLYTISDSPNPITNVIARFSVSADPDVADATSEVQILGPEPSVSDFHKGGTLQFGPDGKLYASFGDGGPLSDTRCTAQDGTSLFGKLLRLEDDGSIPSDNPFVGDAGVRDEIWALGLRNPWRFSFDFATGDIYMGDVGESTVEEINWAPGTSTGGENYGWKPMEGDACFNNQNCAPGTPTCNDPGLTDPIFTYTHTSGKCAAIGGYVYRGCAASAETGKYFFADFCSRTIWSLRMVGGVPTEITDRTAEIDGAGTLGSITSFGQDARGELYLVDIALGAVRKIVRADGGTDCASAAATAYGCGVNPAGSLTILSGLPRLGETVSLGVDNPLGTQSAGSIPVLSLAASAFPNFPCGVVLGSLGMDGGSSELLVALASRFGSNLVGAPWSAPGNPVPIDVPIPNDLTFLGFTFYIQGLMLDPALHAPIKFGLTDAVQLTVGD